ncbi:MAG: ABC transporter permease, partial [Fimbriimonadales bacterium]
MLLGSSLSGFAGQLSSVVATLLGLLLITFVIGRVVPIDPVLSVVGDRAPPEVYE